MIASTEIVSQFSQIQKYKQSKPYDEKGYHCGYRSPPSLSPLHQICPVAKLFAYHLRALFPASPVKGSNKLVPEKSKRVRKYYFQILQKAGLGILNKILLLKLKWAK